MTARAPSTLRLLVVCSSLDLRTPFSATPAWWQLLKGLYEVGVDLTVTTYHGQAPETLWWRAYPNPAGGLGGAYAALRAGARRLTGVLPFLGGATPAGQRLTLGLAQALVAPTWRRHLARILEAEADIDAVLLVSVPPNHLRGVAGHIRRRFGLPVLFYDGDVPASLPAWSGFASGFRIYPGADLAEFSAVLSNSLGGEQALRSLGAAAVHTLYYGADPQVYEPLGLPQDTDVFFFGHTTEYREEAIRIMLADPSLAMPEARFAVRGVGLGAVGRAEKLPYGSFSSLRSCIARSRINAVIPRQPHADLHGSSTMRPFELALSGACMVSSPCAGIEEWFEPGKEIIVVGSAQEAIDRYRFLLRHDDERLAIGQAARERALSEHTSRHRARRLVEIVTEYL